MILNSFDLSAATIGVPAISVTSPNGQESILIGTTHVGINGLRNPDKSIFNNAKRFVVEHYGFPTPGDQGDTTLQTKAPWAQNLTEDEINIYLKRAQCAGAKIEYAQKVLYRPSSQVANQLAYTICDGHITLSRDSWIYSIRPAGLQIDTLEEDAWVESQRLRLGEDDKSDGLKWILARDPKVVMGEIRDDLNVGDYESILEKSVAPLGSPQAIKKFKDIMVTGRSIAWMPKLKQYLDDGHAVIMVGAGHLPGENGLISLLQSSGYTVKTITLPESQ